LGSAGLRCALRKASVSILLHLTLCIVIFIVPGIQVPLFSFRHRGFQFVIVLTLRLYDCRMILLHNIAHAIAKLGIKRARKNHRHKDSDAAHRDHDQV
jgi:NhaP-type Na+/H+ or K+/H+ antiporter